MISINQLSLPPSSMTFLILFSLCKTLTSILIILNLSDIYFISFIIRYDLSLCFALAAVIRAWCRRPRAWVSLSRTICRFSRYFSKSSCPFLRDSTSLFFSMVYSFIFYFVLLTLFPPTLILSFNFLIINP